jgi:hypothetical protein
MLICVLSLLKSSSNDVIASKSDGRLYLKCKLTQFIVSMRTKWFFYLINSSNILAYKYFLKNIKKTSLWSEFTYIVKIFRKPLTPTK